MRSRLQMGVHMPADSPALSRFLSRLLRRSTLTRQEQNAILGLSGLADEYRGNYDIISPGETVDHCCLVAHGIAARYDQMADGKRQITAFHIEGDMCDLHSLACPTAAWGIIAMSRASVLKVPHVQLRRLIADYPAIALAFWRDSIADASILAKWVGNLGRRGAQARVAHLLCEMGLRMEMAGLGSREHFWLDVTQGNLADALGLTSVHINRTLQSLRATGLVRTQGRTIYVDDWARLAKLAEFDPAYLLVGRAPKLGLGDEQVPAVAYGTT